MGRNAAARRSRATVPVGTCPAFGAEPAPGECLCRPAARAETGTALLRHALGELVLAPLTDIQTVEQMMANRPPGDQDRAGSGLPPEIEEQAVHELMDRQYRKTLDKPVGMLGDKSPRQAVKTAAGRRKVADWHKYLENQTARQLDPTDPRRPTASSGCGRSSACSIFANSSCPVADVVGLHRIRSYVYAVASHTCRDDVQSWLKNGRRADRAQVRSAPKGDIND